MTCVTRLAAGMLLGIHLRKALWFGQILGVTSNAESSDFHLWRLHPPGIIRMFCLRPVAGFAVHMRMHAFCLDFHDIGMARLAGFVTRIRDRASHDLSQCGASIRPVFSETLWHEYAAHHQKNDEPQEEEASHSDQVCNILKLNHVVPLEQGRAA